jgi:adenylyltransferase/sulfurtransferase
MNLTLSQTELSRYLKHVQLPEVGKEGQLRLKSCSALIIGVGGLGSPVGMYLAAAGVGKIGLMDGDKVDLTNLHRQVIHSSATIGELKVDSGAERLSALNPEICIERYPSVATEQNAKEIFPGYDVVIDCTDNLTTRLLMNRTCVLLHLPMVHGAVYGFEGQVGIFYSPEGPCYQCLYHEIPDEKFIPDPKSSGLLSSTPGVAGTIMATEVLKLLLGIGNILIGKLLVFDLLTMDFHKLKISRNAKCPVCSHIN